MKLIHGDCLEKLKDICDNSIDICIADLPYGRFKHLDWDTPIDLEKMWKQLNRICKKTTPIFLFGDMKFGVQLINSNPKHFKYEIVHNKMRTTTPLLSRKRLGKATEYVFIFYRKQCVYNYLKYHKIRATKAQENKQRKFKKFLKESKSNNIIGTKGKDTGNRYCPPIPTNVIDGGDPSHKWCCGKTNPLVMGSKTNFKHSATKIYEPKLPTNVVNEIMTGRKYQGKGGRQFEPALPTNVLSTNHLNHRGNPIDWKKCNIYEPTLPTNIINHINKTKGKIIKNITEKPQFILEFLLKYFSNEGDICLDFVMGSGSCGVACKKLNRKFIGIEMKKEHFEAASKRLS